MSRSSDSPLAKVVYPNKEKTQPDLGFDGIPYAPLTTAYDEMLDEQGAVRPHWRRIADFLGRVSQDELENLDRETRRRLKEQGVNYNVYSDPEGIRRPWLLDPLPMLFTEQDWLPIEAGLQQRAQLFSLILNDMLGRQTCLKEGLLPPEVIMENPGFLHSMVGGIPSPLTLYAADLGRGPDGQWWVLSDRTQGPSGAGYILEARMVSKRVLGQASVDYPVAPLAQFFFHLKRHLAALAPDTQREPTIALLSPGTVNEVYFEHTYLAAQLGITLVTGEDLSVRRGKVYLKTVDDLQPVDVIIRRVDDSYCDPLNFRADSVLGVPGLAQAQILGKVGMANPLGSGFLESPGLLPFLPGLAKHFLGEELKLPEVATWWCGQPKEKQYVIENLDDLAIKTVDRRESVIFGNRLSGKQKKALIERINASPWLFVGQQVLSFSTIPTMVNNQLHPRHLVIRAFTAGNGRDYDVMPGGLTRVSPDANTFVVSSQKGGVSKDTWLIRESGSVRDALRLSPSGQRRRTSAILTSRAAENLFWMARYLERCESMLRLLRAYLRQLENYQDYHDEADRDVLVGLKPLIEIYCFLNKDKLPRFDVLRQFILDPRQVGSVAYNLHAAINTAYTVRDLWSGDCWRAVEELEDLLDYAEKNRSQGLALDQFIQPFVTALLAFWGASQESLAINHGGLWSQLGRRLERAQNLSFSIFKACQEFKASNEAGLREVLLESNDCLNSHRRRFGTDMSFYTVWHYLILESTNRRSLVATVEELEPLLKFLNPNPHQGLLPMQKRALSAITPLRLADAGDWSSLAKTKQQLADFLQSLRSTLNQLGFDIEHRYFKHAQPITHYMH